MFSIWLKSRKTSQITKLKLMFQHKVKPLGLLIWFSFFENGAKLKTPSEIFPPLIRLKNSWTHVGTHWNASDEHDEAHSYSKFATMFQQSLGIIVNDASYQSLHVAKFGVNAENLWELKKKSIKKSLSF